MQTNQPAGQPAEPRAGVLRQFARLGLANLFPVGIWRRDRPWRLASVQWFLFFTVFPLFLLTWTGLTGATLRDVTYLYAIYFSMLSGLVIWLFLRPERIGVLDVVRVSLFTSIAGGVIVGFFYQLPLLQAALAATRGPVFLERLAGNVLGVGLLEETVKAVPVLWIFVRNRERGTTREIVYLGCVSGFAFGVSEAMVYSMFYAERVAQGGMPLGAYVVVQLGRLITLPLLHAVFAGIGAQLIALGVEHAAFRTALVLSGVAIAALMHGLYNTFAGTVFGFVAAVAAVLVFIAYVRSIETMRVALREAAERR